MPEIEFESNSETPDIERVGMDLLARIDELTVNRIPADTDGNGWRCLMYAAGQELRRLKGLVNFAASQLSDANKQVDMLVPANGKQADMIRERSVSLHRIVSYAASCRGENTSEWMIGLVERMNEAMPLLYDNNRFAFRDTRGVDWIEQVQPAPNGSHFRKCWDCGNVADHADSVVPWVLCGKCGSQDTRKVKP